MGLFNFGKKKTLVLDESARNKWAQQLAEHKELTKDLAQFRKELRQRQTAVKSAVSALRKEKSTVPERARHITQQHAATIDELMEQTLKEITFDNDIIAFQTHLDVALKALEYYKEHSTKNISALREFYADQLMTLAESLQQLEDLLIKTAAAFDEKDYQSILQVDELTKKLAGELSKKDKYERTLQKYAADQEKNTDKQQKHKKRIEEQTSLVREKNALSALGKIKEIETKDHERKARYERLVFDTKHYILKNELTLNDASKELFTALKKNPESTIKNQHEALKNEFKELQEALGNLEKDDKKDVASRLKKAARDITNDAQKLVNNEKTLHDLKKQVIHDMAALNIYEQEQFLLRTKQEAAENSEKLHVLNEALDELQDESLKEELLHLTKQFGAVIRHEQGAYL
jgi:hypothetical protein